MSDVTSKAKRWVFILEQVTVRHPYVTNPKSGHDRFLFTMDCFGSIAPTLNMGRDPRYDYLDLWW